MLFDVGTKRGRGTKRASVDAVYPAQSVICLDPGPKFVACLIPFALAGVLVDEGPLT